MKKSVLTGALSLMLIMHAGTAFSQCKELVWPENPEQKAKAEESKVLYEDAVRSGQPKELKAAIAPLNWMLQNVPNHHVSLYISGAELFDKLASSEKDQAKKKKYIDSLLIIYDLRVKNCGDESNVINRKALSYVKFHANDKPVESLQMLDKAIELNGNEVLDAMLLPYMQVVRIAKAKAPATMADDQVLQRYDKITAIIDAKIQKAQSDPKAVEKLQTVKGQIDELLLQIIKIDCNFVKKNLEPRYRQNPNDMVLAKKIFTFMLQGKCVDDPLWLEVAEKLHNDPNEAKNCSLAKNIGLIYLSKENYEKAATYLKEAQGICNEPKDKSDILIYLGGIEGKNGRRSAARDLFRQAAQADPSSQKQVWEKIGDLYLGSFDACAEKKSRVDDKLVYLIAYDYYSKAGESRKMAQAKEGFPTKEEIFTEGIDAGTSKSVGCWINETTTIRTRD